MKAVAFYGLTDIQPRKKGIRDMPMASIAFVIALTTALTPFAAGAQMVGSRSEPKHYNVTIRRFDPTHGAAGGQTFVLPVDSPDREHAIASTIANAAAFSKKTDADRVLPVAFMAVKVEPRR